jgi:hypothetical protein
MIANGAVFTITRRDDGSAGFLWEMPKGGDRSRCRALIAAAKQDSPAYWQAFVAAIVARLGARDGS